MNRRQLALVLAGLLVFIAGGVIGLTPVGRPDGDDPGMILPIAQPLEAVTARPGPLLLALSLSVLGVALALVGCYVMRDRR